MPPLELPAASPSRSKTGGIFWGILLLCLALLTTQTLGRLHGLAHGDGHGTAQPGLSLSDSGQTAHPQAPDGTRETGVSGQTRAAESGAWLTGLFAGHDETSSTCLSFDQMGHFDALVSLPLALPMSLTAVQLVASVGLAVARWHAQFQARGPPFPL